MPADKSMGKTIGELVEEVEKATSAHVTAEKAESEARSRTTSTTNRLNVAQKELDKAMEVLKKSAPRGTDWTRVTGRPA